MQEVGNQEFLDIFLKSKWKLKQSTSVRNSKLNIMFLRMQTAADDFLCLGFGCERY